MKRPLQIVELRQPRCALRFGVGTCPATGTPKCYNTWGTCQSAATRAVYDNTGSIAWRFVPNRPGLYAFGSFGVADAIETNGIPVTGLKITTAKGQLNIGGMLDGKSPFGIRATCTITMDDFAWSDPVGDFYLADRVDLPARTFWTTFLARTTVFADCQIVIYDGYEGDALSAMRQRLYVLDGIDGPVQGKVTLRGADPLMLADASRAQFPPAMNISLLEDLTETATTVRVTTDDEANLSGTLGLTPDFHVLIGSEIIGYTGYTVIATGTYQLNGLIRGMGGTDRGTAETGDLVGRVGHFADQTLPEIAKYLLQNHTQIPDSQIDLGGWNSERDTWLSLFRATTFVATPTPVEDLIGELCQQGPFYVWWDEYGQVIRMKAIRPESGTIPVLDDETAILANSQALTRAPESRLTRVFVYWGAKNVLSSAEDNWLHLTGTVDGTTELPQAGGEIRQATILARWVKSDNHAFSIADKLMMFYAPIPRFLSLDLSAKDAGHAVGDVIDVTSRVSVTAEGRQKTERWQITAWGEVMPGQTYHLDAQAFPMVGRFCNMMDAAAPDYPSAATTEKATGGFQANATFTMADGSAAYLMQ